MTNSVIEKLASFDVTDWLGIVSVVMQVGSLQSVSITPETLKTLNFSEQYLAIHALENGFELSFRRPEDIQASDHMIEPVSHTLN